MASKTKIVKELLKAGVSYTPVFACFSSALWRKSFGCHRVHQKFEDIAERFGAKALKKAEEYALKHGLLKAGTPRHAEVRERRPAQRGTGVETQQCSPPCATTAQVARLLGGGDAETSVTITGSAGSKRVQAVTKVAAQPAMHSQPSAVRPPDFTAAAEKAKKRKAVKLGIKAKSKLGGSKRSSLPSHDDSAATSLKRRPAAAGAGLDEYEAKELHDEPLFLQHASTAARVKESEYDMEKLPLNAEGEHDWLNADSRLPRQLSTMDYYKYTPVEGSAVVLILPAWDLWRREHASDFQAAADAVPDGDSREVRFDERFQQPEGVVFATVESKTPAHTDALGGQWFWLTLQPEGSSSQGEKLPRIEVPWVAADADCAHLPSFIVLRDAYERAVSKTWKPGMQIAVKFAHPNPPHSDAAEVYEGRVYHVGPADARSQYPRAEFQKLHVVWYEQEMVTRKWRIDFCQTDNLISPWEVHEGTSVYVKPENVGLYATDVPQLSDAEEVVQYLMQTECGRAFRSPVPRRGNADYYRKVKHPMDLGTMLASAKSGKYAGPAGVSAMWEACRLIIKNAKSYNAPERFEWRLADMLEREARRVKSRFGK